MNIIKWQESVRPKKTKHRPSPHAIDLHLSHGCLETHRPYLLKEGTKPFLHPSSHLVAHFCCIFTCL